MLIVNWREVAKLNRAIYLDVWISVCVPNLRTFFSIHEDNPWTFGFFHLKEHVILREKATENIVTTSYHKSMDIDTSSNVLITIKINACT